MLDYLPVATDDRIALVAAAIALGALGVTLWYSHMTRRQTLRVEKSQAYLQLEVASSEVFKYEAEKADVLAPYRLVKVSAAQRAKLKAATAEAMTAYNLYFQTLNLMEVCTRFRRQDIIEHQVFASWVAWFYDTLDDWYFRDQWDDFRDNYTDDVRDIFDIGVAIFTRNDDKGVDDARKACFYKAVAQIMDCEEIAGWLTKTTRLAADSPRWAKWLEAQAPLTGPAPTKTVRRSRASSPASSAPTRVISATAKSNAA